MLLQQLLPNVSVDGKIGPLTISAANNYDGDIVEDYKKERIEYYTEISKHGNNSKFLAGWIYRVNNTKLI
jgi:lysozyme family protein